MRKEAFLLVRDGRERFTSLVYITVGSMGTTFSLLEAFRLHHCDNFGVEIFKRRICRSTSVFSNLAGRSEIACSGRLWKVMTAVCQLCVRTNASGETFSSLVILLRIGIDCFNQF